MKKIWIIAAVIIGVTILGIGIYQSNAVHGEPDLSQGEVKEIVESQYPGTITEMILESDTQNAVYEVILESDGKGYTIRIDGNTGEVLDMQAEDLPGAQVRENADNGSSKSGSTAENEQEETKKRNDNQDEGAREQNDELEEDQRERTTIDTEEAKRIALNEFDGTVTSLELDEEDGRLIYEIEIERGEDEAEIEIDAFTGEI